VLRTVGRGHIPDSSATSRISNYAQIPHVRVKIGGGQRVPSELSCKERVWQGGGKRERERANRSSCKKNGPASDAKHVLCSGAACTTLGAVLVASILASTCPPPTFKLQDCGCGRGRLFWPSAQHGTNPCASSWHGAWAKQILLERPYNEGDCKNAPRPMQP